MKVVQLLCGVVPMSFACLPVVTGELAAQPGKGEPGMQHVFSGMVGVVVERDVFAGFLVDRQKRLVVASCDTVRGRNRVEVFFPAFKGKELITDRVYYLKKSAHVRGRILYRDPRRKLVLIQLDSLPQHACALKLAANSPRPGDRVHLIGHLDGGDRLWIYAEACVGVVRQGRVTYHNASYKAEAHLVNDALPPVAIGRGSTLVNDRGEVVAIHTGGNPNDGLLAPRHIDVSELQTFLTVVRK